MPKPLPVIAASIAIASSAIAHAQWWLDVPATAIPRTPAGEPDLAAPAPRLTGGRPDFTGLWEPIKTYSRDLADDLIAPDAVPFQPWAKELYAERGRNQLEPHTRCKPSGFVRQFLTPYGV